MATPTRSSGFGRLAARMGPERRTAVSQYIRDISRAGRSFYAMVAISTTIATYGLLSNSIAIVIGAMLVAPLMGPIFGVALGLSSGDNRLSRQAGLSEAVGVLFAIGTAFVIGHLPFRADFGPEIIARTQPTLYDVIVALASGIAGAYALTDEKISPALPGVAIATSLVPPLAACGLCLSAGRMEPAFGAFLLFFANFLAIEIASAFVFILFGVSSARSTADHSLRGLLRKFGLSIVMLLVVGQFMTYTLVRTIENRRLTASVQKTLSQQLRSRLGAQLSTVDVQRQAGGVGVVAVVLTPQQIEPELVGQVERILRRDVDKRIRLVIRSVISADADRSGPVYLADDVREHKAEVREQTEFLTKTTQVMNRQLALSAGSRLVDVRRELSKNGTTVTAVVRGPEAISPAAVQTMQTALSDGLGKPIHLVVRCVLTRDADSNGYLYDKSAMVEPLTAQDAGLYARLNGALKRQCAAQIPGAALLEFRLAHANGRVAVRASTRTPAAFGPGQVKQIEQTLRRYVNPAIDLTIHSRVEADASSSGYVPVQSPQESTKPASHSSAPGT